MLQKELNSDYVKDLYNQTLASPAADYSYNRWQKTPLNVCQYRQTKRVLLKLLGPKKYQQALEVGGGDGVWTEFIINNLKQLDFFDISEEMLKRAGVKLQGCGQINFLLGDFLKNNFASQSYDGLFGFRVWEYFNDKDKALREINRILKVGGDLFLITKSPAYDWQGYYKKKVLHSGQLPILKLLQLLSAYGFSLIAVKPAVLGKLLRWPTARWFFSIAQKLNCLLPFNLLPLAWLQYFSESFIIKARKIKEL